MIFIVLSLSSFSNVYTIYHPYISPSILKILTLSLFFKVSNTGDSILATVHFLYPKLDSFFDMEYFYQLAYRDSKVLKRFVGLNQMQCSPTFDWNWGKQNDPTACCHQLHPRFRVLQQGNAPGTHQSMWAGSLKPPLVWAASGRSSHRTGP